MPEIYKKTKVKICNGVKILAADTSTKIISVALLNENRIIAKLHQPYSRSQGSSLIPTIKKLLENAGHTIKEINLFCVGLGPGSFTGLRASLACMRSLSISLKKPIIGIPSFDAIAYNVTENREQRTENREIGILFDAKQNKLYARFYKQQNDSIEPITDFLLDTIENILGTIKKPTLIVGDAISVYGPKILEINKQIVLSKSEDSWYPKASILAKIAQEKHKKGYTDDPFKLLPLYIYPKECQIRSIK